MLLTSVLHVVVLRFSAVISILLLQQVSLHASNSTSLLDVPLYHH